MVLRRVRGQDEESGAVAVFVAVLSLALFGTAALVVDLGYASSQKRRAQSVADGAALLAASRLGAGDSDATIVTRVKDVAQRNGGIDPGAWNGCSDSTALPSHPDSANANTCISYDRSTAKAQVRLPVTEVATGFGGIFGVSHIPVGGLAQATWGGGGCIVCILGTYDGQNGKLVVTGVTGGGVAIGGNLSLGPNGLITVTPAPPGTIGVVGTGLPPSKGTLSPAGVAIPPFADPLAGLPLPPVPAHIGANAIVGTGNCVPGAYHTVDGCTHFAAGTYTVTSTSKLAGNGQVLSSSGVLFYFTCETTTPGPGKKDPPIHTARACNAGEAGATLDNAGNAVYAVTGMTTGPYKDFVIIFDRNNSATYRQVGASSSTLVGGIYGANVTLDNRGSSGGLSLSGYLVVKAVAFSGQDNITDNVPAGIAALTLAKPAYLTR